LGGPSASSQVHRKELVRGIYAENARLWRSGPVWEEGEGPFWSPADREGKAELLVRWWPSTLLQRTDRSGPELSPMGQTSDEAWPVAGGVDLPFRPQAFWAFHASFPLH